MSIFSKKLYFGNNCMLTQLTKLACTKEMHEMIGYRTTGMSDIHVHIFLAEFILLLFSRLHGPSMLADRPVLVGAF